MLGEAEIQKFREDGFLIVHHFFDEQQTEHLKQQWNEAQAQFKFGDDQLQRVDRFVLGILAGDLGRLYKDDGLVEAARWLLADNDIALYMNRVLMKDDKWNGVVDPHQDITSFHGSLHKLSAFVPLQTHNEATGGLKVIKGSHKYGNFGIQGTIYPEKFPAMQVITPSLEVGDVLFMDFLTWHYSEAATVTCDRPLMQIVYQAASDGSYSDLEAPTLVAGQWRTSHFLAYGYGTARNVVLPGEAEIAQLKTQCELAESRVKEMQAALEAAQNRMGAMESSKFWKLRTTWMQLKNRIFVGAGLADRL